MRVEEEDEIRLAGAALRADDGGEAAPLGRGPALEAGQDRDERRPAPEREALTAAPAGEGAHPEEVARFRDQDRLRAFAVRAEALREGIRHGEPYVRQLEKAECVVAHFSEVEIEVLGRESLQRGDGGSV